MGLEGFVHGLEGARDYALASRVLLRPRVEVGLRHDGEGRRDGRRPGRRRRAGGVGTRRPGWPSTCGADAGDALGRGVPRAGHGGLTELQPHAVDAAGLYGTGGAVVGWTGHERRRGRCGAGPCAWGGGQHSHGAGSLPVERASVARGFPHGVLSAPDRLTDHAIAHVLFVQAQIPEQVKHLGHREVPIRLRIGGAPLVTLRLRRGRQPSQVTLRIGLSAISPSVDSLLAMPATARADVRHWPRCPTGRDRSRALDRGRRSPA